jgi:hypothetical protein
VLDLDLEKKRIGLSLDETKTAEAGVDLGAYAAPAKTEEGHVGSFGALLKESMKKTR